MNEPKTGDEDIHQYIYNLSEMIIGVSNMEGMDESDRDELITILSDSIHILNRY